MAKMLKKNIACNPGAPYELKITTTVDFSQRDLKAQIRLGPSYLENGLLTSFTIVEEEDGIRLSLTQEQVDTITGNLYWDLLVADQDGNYDVFIGGRISKVKVVTEP